MVEKNIEKTAKVFSAANLCLASLYKMARARGGAILTLILFLNNFYWSDGDRFVKEVKNSIFKDSNIEVSYHFD